MPHLGPPTLPFAAVYDPASPPTLVAGGSVPASALPPPLGITFDSPPTWTSASPSIVRVALDDVQTVTAVAAGTATLTATGTQGGSPANGQINVVVTAPATAVAISLSPDTVYTGRSSTASLVLTPSGAGLDDAPIWAAIDFGYDLTPNADRTATLAAKSRPGTFRVGVEVTSSLRQLFAYADLLVLQSYTGLNLANSAPLVSSDYGPNEPSIAQGGTFALTPTLLPPGCTAPVDAGSWTVSPSKAGNTVSIDQTTGVVTVTGNVQGFWGCTVSFMSNGVKFSTATNASVVVLARATAIQITVKLVDRNVVGPSAINLVQGRRGDLVAAAVAIGQSCLDTAPLWETSDAAIVTVGVGLSSGVGYIVPFNVIGNTGSATITCTGRSAGVLVTGTLAVTASAAATGLVLTLVPNPTIPGLVVAATSAPSPRGSMTQGGSTAFTVSPAPGAAGSAQVISSQGPAALILPLSAGSLNVATVASVPTGVLASNTVVLSILQSVRFIQLGNSDGEVFGPGSVLRAPIVGRDYSFTSAVIPGDAVVDAGTWTITVTNTAIATATIDAGTGAIVFSVANMVKFPLSNDWRAGGNVVFTGPAPTTTFKVSVSTCGGLARTHSLFALAVAPAQGDYNLQILILPPLGSSIPNFPGMGGSPVLATPKGTIAPGTSAADLAAIVAARARYVESLAAFEQAAANAAALAGRSGAADAVIAETLAYSDLQSAWSAWEAADTVADMAAWYSAVDSLAGPIPNLPPLPPTP